MERTARVGSSLFDCHFGEAMEGIQEITGAVVVRLARCPPGCFPPHMAAHPDNLGGGLGPIASTQARTCTSPTACRYLDEELPAASLVAGRRGCAAKKVAGWFCAACPLAAGQGETLALQMGFPSPFAPTDGLSGRGGLARVALPLLMWAKCALEADAYTAHLETRARADLLAALNAHEEEREWLAYEVHDRIAQTLVSVFQQLQTVESLAHSVPAGYQAAVRCSALTRQAMREARSIINDLHPPVLDELGLAPLIEEELRRLANDTGCVTRAALSCGARLPRDVELVLYRILHEALINVRRHARARQVSVSLECDAEEARLRVEDDGTGFDVPQAMKTGHIGGLMSMRRRAELAGGTCQLDSAPGRGARVIVRVPYRFSRPAAVSPTSVRLPSQQAA